jgi:hypothetical protein
MTAMYYNITLLKEVKFSNFENQALARTSKFEILTINSDEIS